MRYAWGIVCNDHEGKPFLAFDGEREEHRPMLVSKEVAISRSNYINNPSGVDALREELFQGMGAAPPNAIPVPLPWIVNSDDEWSC